jgi:hypothetical protein
VQRLYVCPVPFSKESIEEWTSMDDTAVAALLVFQWLSQDKSDDELEAWIYS